MPSSSGNLVKSLGQSTRLIGEVFG